MVGESGMNPFARLEAHRQELLDLKVRAELTHFRRLDGTCAFVECSACAVIEQIDIALADLERYFERDRLRLI